MVLGKVFERFVQESPVTVMFRGALEYVLPASRIDALFRQEAQSQREDRLLFSTVVDLLGLAVTGQRRSVHAAYRAAAQTLPVSVKSLYNKLNGSEPQVARSLVRESAARLAPVLRAMSGGGGGPAGPLLAGYRVKILDGKHFAGTEHRLPETRTLHSVPLPGQLLTVLDPQLSLAIDVFPCEDAYAQERSLLPDVLPTVEAGDVWVADRNFCTTGFLFGIAERQAFFLIRQHGSTLSGKTLRGRRRHIGRCETGVVFEQEMEVIDPQTGDVQVLRRITIELDRPTRDGERVIHLLTNLPPEAGAITLGELYLERWQVENLFGQLAQSFEAEINTLCFPAAAVLAYCVALLTYNLQSSLKAALQSARQSAQGERAVMEHLSTYYLADEIRSTYRGLMIAIEPSQWSRTFGDLSPHEMAAVLTELAGHVRWDQFQKTTRGERKPRPPRTGGLREKHVSTARLIKARNSAATDN